MANSLKRFVEKQLKENITLPAIRKDLKEKGYRIEEINRAIRYAISDTGKKLPSTIIVQIGILVIGVVIAIVAGVYFADINKIPNSLSEKFCGDFLEIEGKTNCQDAIVIALKNYPGNIESVDKINALTRSEEQKPAWLVEIRFTTPLILFDKPRNALNITVDMEGNVSLYKLGA